MNAKAFKAWLSPRYTRNSVNLRYSAARRVEEAYGDLDAHFEADRLAGVIDGLHYSLGDAKIGRSNPTKLKIDGSPYNMLNNFKTGVRTYRDFRDEGGEDEVVADAAIELAGEVIKEKREGRQFELERHLQDSLRRSINQLEYGLNIIDEGLERGVESGFVDILAQDSDGALVVVELKAGQAKREALGQILGYMGDLKGEEPGTTVRGILVAASFDKSCRSAVAVVPSIALREYRFDFTFSPPE